ncbi:hypothetical protein ACWFN4_28645 [Bacillus mycoides]
MIIEKRFPVEHYHCTKCNQYYTGKQMGVIRAEEDYALEKWTCPKCNLNLHIYVKDGTDKDATALVVERKLGSELVSEDCVVFSSVETTTYLIKKHPEYKNGRIYVTFAEYGVKDMEPTNWVNRYLRRWDGDTSKLK